MAAIKATSFHSVLEREKSQGERQIDSQTDRDIDRKRMRHTHTHTNTRNIFFLALNRFICNGLKM